ncbi:MAG: S1 RNA-binding domain-containing protein [Oscillospiraceae bacterium]|nr:S1 RNA-binding domain-containing protein [Oscillospiraceae bacterium]
MIELGKIQILEAVRQTPNGVYLNTRLERDIDDVLLPKNQVSQELTIGDSVEVFVYKDSEDRIIATVKKPKITLGELAVLKVVETTNIGAFLDWGLEKDLLLPFKEQEAELKKDDMCLVTLYVDNSKRLCATMKVYNLLSTDSPYKNNDRVRGIVYSINMQFGYFVAVDNKYHGLILDKEAYGSFAVGDTVEARIKKVRTDGKLELSVRDAAYKEIDGDSQKILSLMKTRNGKLNLNDNSSPEKINSELNMSKKAFKRAVGRLMKEGAIKITDEGIEALWD